MFKAHQHLRVLLAMLFLDGLDSGGSDSDSGGSDSGDSGSSSASADSASSSADVGVAGADAAGSSSNSPGQKPVPKITDIPPDALQDIPFRQDS